MNSEFATVFEASYFSNGSLLGALILLSSGVLAMIFIVSLKPSARAGKLFKWLGIVLCILLWVIPSAAGLVLMIRDGHEFTNALKSDQYSVVTGTVSVIHLQSRSGTDAGDRIWIGDKEFIYSWRGMGLGYQRTVARGGVLTDGAFVRLCYLGNSILKVEVRKRP